MKPGSRINSLFRRWYGLVLRRQRIAEAEAEMPNSRRQAIRALRAGMAPATMDVLEPRLMLSGAPWEVSLATDDRFAAEQDTDPAAVVVTRTDTGTGDINQPLTVDYTVGGTATAVEDYQALGGTVEIPAGQSSASIVVTPVDDDRAEFDERVVLTLADGAGYDVDPAAETALVTLVDNDLGVVPTGEAFGVSQTSDPTPQQVGDADAAFLAGGGRVVLWSSIGDDGSSWGVFGRILDENGATVGSQFAVNATTTGIQTAPAVAALADGNFVAIWRGKGADDSTGVVGRLFDASGTALSDEFQINTTTQGVQEMPDVATLADGRFIVAWSGKGTGDNYGVYGRLFLADGTPVDEEFAFNVNQTYQQFWPALAALPDGGFLAAWTSGYGQDGSIYGVFARRFDSTGTAAEPEFQVNTTTQSDQQYPSIAVAPDGEAVIVWQSDAGDGSANCILGQRYDAAGTATGPEFLINSFTMSNQWSPSVAFGPGGRFLVSWCGYADSDTSGVHARELASDGTPLRDQFLVYDESWSGTQTAPVVAGDPDGYLVAWSGDGPADEVGVFARAFVPGNTAPVASVLADVEVLEDAPDTVIDLFGAFTDTEHFDDELSYAVVDNTNPGLFAATTIDQAAGTLTLAYAPNAYGSAEITVRGTDPRGLFAETTFSVVVTSVNDVPTTTGIADVGVDEDAPATVIDLAAAFDDIETLDADLTYEINGNSNPSLFSSTDISGTELTLAYAPNANGSAAITVRATDPEGAFVETTFNVVVAPVNDVPTTSGIADVGVDEDAPATAIDLAAAFDDIETPDADLVYEVISNTTPSLFSSTDISGTDLTLAYAPNANGSAVITVSATDPEGASVETTFSVVVAAVNDTPTTTGIADVGVDEDAPATVIDLFEAFDDVESAEAALTYDVVGNTNPALFSSVTVGQAVNLTAATAGLLGHWQLDDTGSTALDSAGDNDGVLSGSPVWGGGYTGGALQLDGIDDSVGLGNPAELNFTGQITLAAWVRPEATDGLRNIVAHGYHRSPNGEVFLRIANGEYQIGSWDGTDHKTACAIPAEDIGQWVHLAGTYDGTTWRLYRNGAEVAAAANATGAVLVQDNWAIGARGTGDERFFDGTVDDVRIYDRALTAEELAPVPNGELTLAYAPNANGSAAVTVRATDPEGAFAETAFNVVVAPVNDVPTTSGIADVGVDEDAPATVIDLAAAFEDIETPDADLTYAIMANTNPSLFSSTDTSGTELTLVYAPNANGSAELTVRATDLEGAFAETTFNVVVAAVNDVPTTSGVADVGVDEDAPATVIDLAASFDDVETADTGLAYDVTANSNPSLFSSVRISPAAFLPGVTDGLVGHWRFDEGSGTVAADATDNGNDGVLNGSPVWSDGMAGGALGFNGTNDYVSLGNPAELDITGPIALAAWIKPESIDGFRNILVRGYVSSPAAEVYLRIGNGQYQTGSWTGGGQNHRAGFYVPAEDIGQWVHLCGVYDGTTWRLYRYGQEVATGVYDTGAVTVTDGWAIGARSDGTERFFHGMIDDVRIYDRALTAEEVAPVNDGQLTLAYAPNANGSAAITVRATDPEGAAAETTFNVVVAPVNDVPTTSGIADVGVDEDAPATVIDLAAAFDDIETPDADLTYVITANTDPSLFSSTNIGGTELTLAYAPNANGSAAITVSAADPEGASIETTFNVVVAPVNDVPTTTGLADVGVDEDAPATVIDLAAAFDDIETPDADLTYTVAANSNPSLFSSTDISGTELTLAYGPNANGSAVITVRATDPEDTFAETTFNVVVAPVNDVPTTAGIADVGVDEDAPATVIDLAAAFDDIETNDADLVYEVISNTNPSLFNSTDISGTNLTLAYAPNAYGSAVITVRATDAEAASVETTFNVVVAPVNDVPTTTGIADVGVDEDAPATVIDLTTAFDDVETASVYLTYTVAANTNPSLFSSTDIADGQLTLAYAPNANGSAAITVRAIDPEGAFAEATFNVVVAAVNDAPTTTGLADIAVDGGTVESVVDLAAAFADVEDVSADLTYTVADNTNPDLFSSTDVNPATGRLTLVYAPGQVGTADLTVRATDSGGLYVETAFSVEVLNTPPAALGIANISILEDSSPTYVDLHGAFTDIQDSGDLLTYEVVSNTNPDVVVPLTDENGQLSFAYEGDAFGTAEIVIRATDTAGLYAENAVIVDVDAVNDAPVIGALLDGPDPAIEGADLTLEIDGLTDDSADVSVAFYRDADADGELNTAVDQLLGVDTLGTNAGGYEDWSITVSTEGFGNGPQTYFAQATDSGGLASAVVSATGTVGIVGVIDDGEPGYEEYGTYEEFGEAWTDGTGSDGYKGDHREHTAGTGVNKARWTFTGLTDGPHKVYVTWVAGADRATNAPFTVYDGTDVEQSFAIDQQAAPAGVYADGTWWDLLGTYEITSGEMAVQLTDEANGVVVADAVRLIDPPPTIGSLAADRDRVIAGDQIVLTAENVTDTDGTVTSVAFYRDSNDNDTLEVGTDELLGTDTVDSDGWSITVDTSAAWSGGQTFFAQATDNDSLTSDPAADDVTALDDVTTNLLGHWRLNDASGTVAEDAAGSNDGTLAGGPAWVDGQAGGALEFDGTNDYVGLGNPAELNFTGPITIAAWVKPDATGGLRNIVAHGHHLSPKGEVFLRINNGQYQIGSWNGSNHNTGSTIPSGDIGQWVHLAGTYDGGTWRLYRNGVEVAATGDTTGAVLVQDNWAIGARGTGTERFFDGGIDDVRIYDRALADNEIIVLADKGIDHAPVIGDQTFAVPDSPVDGSVVGTVAASDPDLVDTISYAITAGNHGDAFAIDSSTGELTVADASELDFATNPLYQLTVEVTNSPDSGASDTAVITVFETDVTDGLLGHWALDEVSGDAAADSAGDNDGTVAGATWDAGGTMGGALTFDGSGDYVSLGNPSELNFSGNITISAWVKPQATGGTQNIVAHGYTRSPNGEVYLRIASGQYQIGSWDGAGHNTAYAIPAGDVGNWVHLTGAYDGTHWRLYRNGVEVAATQETTGAVTVGANWAIGARGNGGERFFQGMIDDVRIYNRALSAAEAAVLADNHVNSAPQIATQGFDVPETAGDGTVVGTVTASDVDLDDTLSFAITAGNHGSAFAIDSATGEITVADSAAMDFVTYPVYNLTVEVTDDGVPVLSSEATVQIAPSDLTEGLAGHWHLDEASGTLAEDATANDNDGSVMGDPEWVAGREGASALQLDGSGDYVSLGNPDALKITGDITLSAWVRPEATDGYRNIIAHGYTTSPKGEVFLRIADGQYQVGSWDGSSHVTGSAVPSEDIGNWVLLTGTHDGTTWRLYRNGAEVASSTDSVGAVTVNANWAVGARGNGNERYFDGAIDEVRIYDRALTAAEAQALIDTAANASPEIEDQTFATPSDSEIGAVVGTVIAGDIDEDDTLSFAITAGNVGGAFAIDSATGQITVAAALDFGTNPTYDLTVEVTDDGDPALSDTATVSIMAGDVTAGLLAHWRLDDAGTTALDSAGDNDGTLIGGVAWTEGYTGGAVQLDGVNDFVGVGNPTELNFTGQITLAAWVRPEATDGLRNIVAHGYHRSPDGEVFLRINSGQYQIGSWDGSDHKVAASIPSGDVGSWVHLAGTYDGEAWRLYRNGILVAGAEDVTGAVEVLDNWAIGARGTGTERFFDGTIDDVRIYNRPINEAEIAVLIGRQPEMTALAGPSVVMAGMDAGLTAEAYDPAGATITSVEFYRDANANGALEVGTDVLVGTDNNGGDGWSAAASTTDLSGQQVFFARGSMSGSPTNTVATTVTVSADTAVGDDGDAAYAEPDGDWSDGQMAGAYGQDYRQVYLDGTANSATWTFDNLPDGSYAVYTTHVAAANHAQAANFTVYQGAVDPGNVVGSATIDQQDAPGDLAYAGRDWALVDVVQITGGQLTVEVSSSSSADQWLLADAVCLTTVEAGQLTSVAAPDMVTLGDNIQFTVQVFDPGNDIDSVNVYLDANGNGVLDGGDTLVGEGIEGQDVWAVSIATDDSAPADELKQTGDKRLFVQAVDDGTPVDEMSVTVLVSTAVAIVDNSDPEFTTSGGNWDTGSGGYNGDYRFHAKGDGDASATWSVTGLDPETYYHVYATWAVTTNAARDAEFAVSGVTAPETRGVDQRSAPSDKIADERTWATLGAYKPTGADSLTVTLSNYRHGAIVADAIRVEESTGLSAITGNVTDFYADHSDFQGGYPSEVMPGLVKTNLSAGGRPELVDDYYDPDGDPQYPYGDAGIESAESFAGWYPGTGSDHTIRLADIGNGVYKYSSTSFFPLGRYNNHFTMHATVAFTYYEGTDQYVKVVNDDDVWVFIDGTLAIDSGGYHWPAGGTAYLDSRGLTDGQSYEIDIFTAERQIWGSTFEITLGGGPKVAITATNAYARETNSQDPREIDDIGVFTVSRGEGNTSGDLEVYYTIETSPTNALAADQDDYEEGELPGSVTIPNGQSSVTITVTPTDDATKEWDEVVQLTLTGTDLVYNSISADDTTATVTILDNDEIGGFIDRNVDTESTGLSRDVVANGTIGVGIQQGDVTLALPLTPYGFAPSYRSDDNLHPIVSVEMQLPGGEVPHHIQATLTFGQVASDTVAYALDDIASTSDELRFVLLGDETISEKLRTGHYDYDVEFVATFADGSTLTRTVRSSSEVVNLVDNTIGEIQYGDRWWIDGLDRIVPDDGNSARLAPQGLAAIGGTALIRGDNTSGWYVAEALDSNDVNVIDNTDSSRFTTTGEWVDGTHEGGQGGGYLFYEDPEGSSSATATWTFGAGLNEERLYQLFATWVPDADRADAVPFEITGATRVGTRPVGFEVDNTVEIDQRYTPGEVIYEGTHWRSLGFYTLDSGSSIIAVELDATGLTDQVVADAVMLVEDWQYITPDGSFNELYYFDVGESAGSIAGATYFVRHDYAAQAGTYALLTKWGGRHEFDYQGLLNKQVDRNNNQTRYDYTDDLLATITTQGGLTWTYAYAGGKLDSITDFNNRVTEYTVGESVTTVTGPDPDGPAIAPQTTFQYSGDHDGLLSTVTSKISDSANAVTQIGYGDGTFRVCSVTNADGHDWQITPFLVDGLTDPVIRKPAGGFQGGGSGEYVEAEATYFDGRANTWTYQTDGFGLRTAEMNPYPFEDVWKWARNADGLLINFTEPAGGGGTANLGELMTTYGYDGKGNVTNVMNAKGERDVRTYNTDFGRVTSYERRGASNELMRRTVYAVDAANGNIASMTEHDVLGDVGENRVTAYDDYTSDPGSITALAGGLVESVTVADNSLYGDNVTTTTAYYDTGLKIGLVHMVTYAYGSGNTDAEGTVIYGYDDNRNPNSVKDELNRETTFIYDSLDRLTQTTLPDPDPDNGSTADIPVTDYEYDAVGNRTAVIDAAGQRTDYTYDAMGRLLTTTLPAPGGDSETDQTRAVTTLTYDPNGNLATSEDPLGRVTTHVYDQRNLRTDTILPAPNTPVDMDDPTPPLADHAAPEITFAYDSLGNLKSQTDPLGNQTTYVYDQLHRQTKITRPATSGQYGHASPITRYEYDAAGQVVQAFNPDPKDQDKRLVVYEYDSFGRMTRQTLPENEDGKKAVTDYLYDLRDNRLFVINAKGQVTEYEYDQRNRVTDTYAPDPDGPGEKQALHTAYDYKITGEVESVTVSPAGGSDERMTFHYYDNLGRVISTTEIDPDGGGPLGVSITDYYYDVMGNRTEVVSFKDSGIENATTYEYDNLNRAWRVEGFEDAQAKQSETITVFDRAGRVVKVKQKTDPAASTYRISQTAYDDLDRVYRQISPEPGDGADIPVTYSYYDAASNTRFVIEAAKKSDGTIEAITETEHEYDELNRRVKTIEPEAVGQHGSPITQFVYNVAGETVKVIDALGRVTEYVFDNLGQLIKTILPAASPQAEILYSYDILGNMVSTTDPEGNVTQYVYDGLNRQISTIRSTEDDPFNAIVDDGSATFVDPADWQSETDSEAYNGGHHTITDGLATDYAEWAFTVDADTKYMVLTTWAGDDANAPDATYTVLDGEASEGNITVDQSLAPADRVLDGHSWHVLGVYTVVTTGDNNLKVKLSGESAETGARVVADAVRVIGVGATTTTDYDWIGQVASTTDELDRTTTYDYDLLGRQTRVTYPNPDGAGVTSVDETVDDETAVYEPTTPADWQVEETKGGYGESYHYYDGTGTGTHTATWTVTVPAGKDYEVLATWVPDAANETAVTFRLFDGDTSMQIGSDIVVDQTQLTSDVVLDGTSWQRLDVAGVTTSTLIVRIDASDATDIVIADAVRIVEAGSAMYTTYTYDLAGNVLTERNAKGETTTFGYDELLRQTSVTDPNDATTEYTYDYLGRNTSITDPEDNTTTYIYDGLDRLVEEQIVVDSSTLSRTYDFDALGNTTRLTDRDGRVVTYDYDELQRVVAETWYDNAADADAEQNARNTVTYAYDVVSRTAGIADDYSDYDYTYDNRDRLTGVTSNNSGLPTVVLTIGYDRDDDLRTSLSATIDGTDDFLNTYTYDELLRMTEIKQTGQSGGNTVADKRVTYAYLPDGQLDTTTRYADTDSDGQIDDLVATTSYTYDDAARLTDLVHAQGATQIAAYNWTFDAAGRITQFLHTDYTDTDHTSDYTYDDAGQLTAADHDTQDDEAYTYDDNGNRVTGNGETYATGDQNRMASDGTYAYEYDDEGNRTLRYVDVDTSGTLNTGDTDITEYDYDHRNRLTEVADYATYADYTATPTPITTMTAQYIYDVNGDRIAKIVDADGSGSTYSEVRTSFVVLDSEILLEFNGQTLAYRYLPGPAIDMNLAIEEIKASPETNETLWSLPDHQGTVRDVIDDSGTVQNHIEYDTFGQIVSESDDTVDYRFTYTGRELDPETGLYYYRARYYDAANGVFISTDPIAFEAGDPNLYRYVTNSPLIATDPMGYGPEWHHLIDKSIFTKDFLKKHGITDLDVNSAQYGWVADFKFHRQAGGGSLHSAGWSRVWRDWIARSKKAGQPITRASILKQLGTMKRMKQFKGTLAKGRKAVLSYNEWRAFLRFQQHLRDSGQKVVTLAQFKRLRALKAAGRKGKAFVRKAGKVVKIGGKVVGVAITVGTVVYFVVAPKQAIADELGMPVEIMELYAETAKLDFRGAPARLSKMFRISMGIEQEVKVAPLYNVLANYYAKKNPVSFLKKDAIINIYNHKAKTITKFSIEKVYEHYDDVRYRKGAVSDKEEHCMNMRLYWVYVYGSDRPVTFWAVDPSHGRSLEPAARRAGYTIIDKTGG